MTASPQAIGDSIGAGRPRRRREPVFEPPPWFAGSTDRRLVGRAEAVWDECRVAGAVPDASVFAAALAARLPDTGNFIRLVFDYGRPAICEVGGDVAHVFGLRDGALAAAGPLGRELAAGYATSLHTRRPTAVEGGFARIAGQPATLLTRGIVLPLAGPGGTIVAAYAVVTWKEALSIFASDQLCREVASVYPLTVREHGRPRLATWQ